MPGKYFPVSDAVARQIYALLAEKAGAPVNEMDDFIHHASGKFHAHWNINASELEWRFRGNLGFGGKIWMDKSQVPVVRCYYEHLTPETQVIIDEVNKDLKTLMENEYGK